jgi:hypothetical protein
MVEQERQQSVWEAPGAGQPLGAELTQTCHGGP